MIVYVVDFFGKEIAWVVSLHMLELMTQTNIAVCGFLDGFYEQLRVIYASFRFQILQNL